MTDREYDLTAFAQKSVVAGLELFGQRIPPDILAGAIEDAGGLDGYATVKDYGLALGDFIRMRRCACWGLPGLDAPSS